MEYIENGVLILMGFILFNICNYGIGINIIKESTWLSGISRNQFIRYIISCIVTVLITVVGLLILCSIAYVLGWIFALIF